MLTQPDINSELDELDREEFYRLKKVANKKARDTAAADAEMKEKKAQQQLLLESGQENEVPAAEGPDTTTDILAAEEDQDVIF